MSRKSYSHVACCIDRTEASERVQARGAELADLFGARLSVVHILTPAISVGGTTATTPAGRHAEAQSWVEQRASQDEGAHGVVVEGTNIGEAVCVWAAENEISLLVVGQREGSILENIGSSANYVVRHAPCDVLVAHPER